jgi:Mn-dependent DtxR family transcriptional regulator
MSQQILSRRLSLEEGFMHYNSDDLLFGAMQFLATFHNQEKILYLTKIKYKSRLNDIYEICQTNPQSNRRHLKRLMDKGLVAEKNLIIGNKEYACYIFPYDEETKYQIVDNKMLWYVISTRNPQAVRIYNYLVNIYTWKKTKENQNYIFTYKELAKVIGYSDQNKLSLSIIRNILHSFKNEGIIDYEEYYDTLTKSDGTTVPTPRKKLTFVALHENELSKNEPTDD